ncbi:MAG: c-type cytochrome, partial [Planctomycetales bacterium]|nr:c-type cytochrome [Planctomycetales bacterium]
LVLLFVANSLPLAASAQDDDDEPELNSGLLARYSNQSGQSAERIDSQIAFDWDKSAPDERLAAGPFTARWRGMLMSQARGEYRLFAHASGTVRIELAGQAILNSRSDEPAWHASEPIQIPFDWHPIEIEYLSGGESAQLALFWSGPNFALEPISDRNWFHEPAESNRAEFERGRQLARALRCEACHQAATNAQPGPSLERLTGAVRREWLMDWLTSMPESETQLAAPRRMPHFAFTADEANDVANYLLSAEPVDLRIPAAEDANAKPSPKANNKNQPADEPPSGERLFLTLGCLACHPHGQAGSASLFGGNSLTHAGDKRPADYFAKWLAEPASLNAQHRMPVFDLSAAERTALAEWLAKQTRGRVDQSGEPSNADAPPANRDASVEASIERGRKLTLDSGCQACHQMPTGEKDNVAPSTPRLGKLSTDSRWERACSAADFDAARPAARRQPIYQLADADRAALRHYFAQRLDLTAEPSQSQAGR